MEETKPSRMKEIFSKDFTHIFIVFVTAIVLVLVFYYVEPIFYILFPLLGGTVNIQFVAIFIILFPIAIGLDLSLLFAWGGYFMFQSSVIIISIIILIVGIAYFFVHTIINQIGVEVKRTKNHKIGKLLGLYGGLGIGVYLVVSTFRMENLFNFNIITIFVMNVKDYFKHIIEFALSIGVSGLLFGYLGVLIVDLGFYVYYKLSKRKFYRKRKVTGITTKQELEFEKKVSSKLGIKFSDKTQLSKVATIFLIAFIVFSSTVIANFVLSKDTTIRIRFSPSFNVYGEYRNVTSWGFMTGVGLYSLPFDLIDLMAMDLSQFSNGTIVDLSIPFLSVIKPMALNMFYLGNLEFTVKIPKSHNIMGLTVWFLYKYNYTDELAWGRGFFPFFIENTPISKTITIHGLYTYYYKAGHNLTLGEIYAYPLFTVEDNFNPFDYLFW